MAYIKLGKYNRAIDDCTKVLEYIELFEKGYEKSKDISLKAFLRRALAWKEKGEGEKALKDLEEAEKLSPKNKEIDDLRKTLNFAEKHKEKAKEIEKNEKKQKEIEKIEGFLAKDQPKPEEIDQICKILSKNEAAKVYLFEHKGFEHGLKLIETGIYCFLLLNIH